MRFVDFFGILMTITHLINTVMRLLINSQFIYLTFEIFSFHKWLVKLPTFMTNFLAIYSNNRWWQCPKFRYKLNPFNVWELTVALGQVGKYELAGAIKSYQVGTLLM